MNDLDDGSSLKKYKMSDHEKIVDFRLDALEINHRELKEDIKEVKDLCIKMDKKLSGIPDGGLPCGIHTLKMDDLTKRVDKIEITTNTLTTKIVTWTSACAVVIFLISQLVIPYFLGSFKSHDINKPVPGLITR